MIDFCGKLVYNSQKSLNPLIMKRIKTIKIPPPQLHVVLVQEKSETVVYPIEVNGKRFGRAECPRSPFDEKFEKNGYRAVAILKYMVKFHKEQLFQLKEYLRMEIENFIVNYKKKSEYLLIIAPKGHFNFIKRLLIAIEDEYNLILLCPVLEDSRLKGNSLRLEVTWNRVDLVEASMIPGINNNP